jgi:hypothetical protein
MNRRHILKGLISKEFGKKMKIVEAVDNNALRVERVLQPAPKTTYSGPETGCREPGIHQESQSGRRMGDTPDAVSHAR